MRRFAIFLSFFLLLQGQLLAQAGTLLPLNGPLGFQADDMEVNAAGHVAVANRYSGLYLLEGQAWDENSPVGNTLYTRYALEPYGIDGFLASSTNTGINYRGAAQGSWEPLFPGMSAITYSANPEGEIFAFTIDQELVKIDTITESPRVLRQLDVFKYDARLFSFSGADSTHFLSFRMDSMYWFDDSGAQMGLSFLEHGTRLIDLYKLASGEFLMVRSTGIFRSADGRSGWEQIADPPPLFNSSFQAASMNGEEHLYLATSKGLYRTTDLGQTYESLPCPLINPEFSSTSLKYDPVHDRFLVNIVNSSNLEFYFVSPDFDQWAVQCAEFPFPKTFSITADTNNVLYASVGTSYSRSRSGCYRSLDDGQSWEYFEADGLPIRQLEADRLGNLYALLINDSLRRSSDGGSTWLDITPAPQVGLIFGPSFELGYNGEVLCSYELSNGMGQYFLSNDQGGTWVEMPQTNVRGLAEVHPNGDVYWVDDQGMDVPNLLIRTQMPDLVHDTLYQATRILDLFISSQGSIFMSLGAGRVRYFYSSDDGENFTPYNNSLFPSYSTPSGILLSTTGVGVFLSRTDGLIWESFESDYWHFRDVFIDQEDRLLAAVEGAPVYRSGPLQLDNNLLTGALFRDADQDCIPGPTEDTLVDFTLVAFNDSVVRYSANFPDGRYVLPLPSGDFTIALLNRYGLWVPCQDSIPINFPGSNDTLRLDFGMQEAAECPLLEVKIATERLRRCFPNTYEVTYSNIGTRPADTPFVLITLDSLQVIDQASIPFVDLGNDQYRFVLDTLEVFEHGSFSFTTLMYCDSVELGQTLCAEAHIFPDTSCLPPDPFWSGASISVSGECKGDSVEFTITNTGSGDMDQPRQYVVIEDVAIMRISSPFSLPAGESVTVAVEANGPTLRLEVAQVDGHPGNSLPSATVEGCGSPPFTFGLFNQFEQDDSDLAIDIECREVIGSYDPNDKLAIPTGFQEEQFIRPNRNLEYTIRFQNTGTDTAFRVVIRDTLSSELDPSTLEMGPSSHPYTWKLEEGPVLEFTFDQILLPDSSVNLAASNGFVRFRIGQQPDLEPGTRIFNQAAIFFDFNAPIITNRTFHEIMEEFITLVGTEDHSGPEFRLRVYPNPLEYRAVLEIMEEQPDPGSGYELRLFDRLGRSVLQRAFRGRTCEIYRSDLSGGLYFFSVAAGGKLVGSGKLLVK